MPPEWTCTFARSGRSRTWFAALLRAEASRFALKQATSRNLRTKRKLNTATSVNAKRQRASRAVCHLNQPSHVLTFAKKTTDTRITARKSRLHSKESSPRQNPSNLFASSFFQQRIASIALGAFRHISPKTLRPYEINQRPDRPQPLIQMIMDAFRRSS